jgi:hypothetical protein
LASNRFDFTSNFNIVWIYRENFGNWKIKHLLHEQSN